MKVLLVEDYALAAALVRDTLRRRAPDIQLDTVSTVAEALARLQGEPARYDLLLTDLNLPDGEGQAIVSHVRTRKLDMAVVILTGSTEEDTALGMRQAGADDCVAKRDDYLAVLADTLRAALARHRAGRAQAQI